MRFPNAPRPFDPHLAAAAAEAGSSGADADRAPTAAPSWPPRAPSAQGLDPARCARCWVEVERKLAALEAAASTDPLTQLYNRRHFDRVAAAELERARRYGQATSLVLFDIDHFKQVNDRHGHPTGDRVLERVARVVREAVRASDTPCRWGGEELVVLTPGVGSQGARQLALRVCDSVRRLEAPGAPGVTLSAGVSELSWGDDLDSWLRRADEALYRAKEGGRDRVELGEAPARAAPVFRLTWSSALESGHGEIDAQHLELFALANELLERAGEAALEPGDRRSLVLAMDRLVAHVVEHFAFEEALLDTVGYPEAAHHRAAHRQLVGQARRLGAELRGTGPVDVAALHAFVGGRLVAGHLLHADTRFFGLLRAEGRPAARAG